MDKNVREHALLITSCEHSSRNISNYSRFPNQVWYVVPKFLYNFAINQNADKKIHHLKSKKIFVFFWFVSAARLVFFWLPKKVNCSAIDCYFLILSIFIRQIKTKHQSAVHQSGMKSKNKMHQLKWIQQILWKTNNTTNFNNLKNNENLLPFCPKHCRKNLSQIAAVHNENPVFSNVSVPGDALFLLGRG